MTEHQHTPPTDAPAAIPAPDGGVSRRRLMRAGLSAAPVLATLKSNSVLAGGGGTCIKPSSFSSLAIAEMVISKGRAPKSDYACNSHGYWKDHHGKLTLTYKSETPFISDITGFTRNPRGRFTGKSLQQVLEMTSNFNNTALARHVVAAFLSAVSNGDNPNAVILTEADCVKIWNGQGEWTTNGGTKFTLIQTMAYFDYVFG